MKYLDDAHAALLDRADTAERVDVTTKLGVGAGVVGAGVNSVLRHGGKGVVASLTFGAISYIANRDTAPGQLERIYLAGVNNLECIRSSAVVAEAHAGLFRRELMAKDDDTPGANEVTDAGLDATPAVADVHKAIAALRKDIAAAEAYGSSAAAPPPPPPKKPPKKPLPPQPPPGEGWSPARLAALNDYKAEIEKAQQAINSAHQTIHQLRLFVSNDGVGEQVVGGVGSTIQIVNQAALQSSPDVDAILQSGSAFGTFLSTGAGWQKSIQSQVASLTQKAHSTAGEHSPDPLLDKFGEDELRLATALSRLPTISMDADLAAISQCHTVIATLAPVTVTPNPVALTAGGDPVKLKITGTAPFVAHWGTAGPPAGVTYDNTKDPPTLTAADDAKAGSYNFDVTDAYGVDSGAVPLTVAAKAQTPPNNPEGGAPQGGKPQPNAGQQNSQPGGPQPPPAPTAPSDSAKQGGGK